MKQWKKCLTKILLLVSVDQDEEGGCEDDSSEVLLEAKYSSSITRLPFGLSSDGFVISNCLFSSFSRQILYSDIETSTPSEMYERRASVLSLSKATSRNSPVVSVTYRIIPKKWDSVKLVRRRNQIELKRRATHKFGTIIRQRKRKLQ